MSFPPRRPLGDVIAQGAGIGAAAGAQALETLATTQRLGLARTDQEIRKEELRLAKDVQAFNEEIERGRRREEEAFNQLRLQLVQQQLKPLKGVTANDVKALVDRSNPERSAAAFQKVLTAPGGPDALQKVQDLLVPGLRTSSRGGQTVSSDQLQAILQGAQQGDFSGVEGDLPAGVASTSLQFAQNMALEGGRQQRSQRDFLARIAKLEQDDRFFRQEFQLDYLDTVSGLRLDAVAEGAAMQQRFQDFLTDQQFPAEFAQRFSALLSIRFQDQIPARLQAMQQGQPPPQTVNDWLVEELASFGLSGSPGNKDLKRALENMEISMAADALRRPGLFEAAPFLIDTATDKTLFPGVEDAVREELKRARKTLGGDVSTPTPAAERPATDNAFKEDQKRAKTLGEQREGPKTVRRRGQEFEVGGQKVDPLEFVKSDEMRGFLSRNANLSNEDLISFLQSKGIQFAELESEQQTAVVEAINAMIAELDKQRATAAKSQAGTAARQRKNVQTGRR